jgi:uncharacterized membrane protein
MKSMDNNGGGFSQGGNYGGGRIESIDAARGLCVLLMVAHHFLYDLCEFLGAPWWLFTNPILDVAHYFFAGMFIFLSGVSSRFSHSNILRGLKVIAAALVITAVTWFMDMAILFGILHFLGFCMVFYGLTHRFFDKIPKRAAPVIYIFFLVITAILINKLNALSLGIRWLWPLGITYPGFASADYFPLFPWIFVFLLGTWAGDIVRSGILPKTFYTWNIKYFPSVGRKAFIIYLVHQPALYGITLLLGKILDIL